LVAASTKSQFTLYRALSLIILHIARHTSIVIFPDSPQRHSQQSCCY
jgi:hypothetical protein